MIYLCAVKRFAPILFVAIFLIVLSLDASAQCAMCKAVVENAESTGKLGGTTDIGSGLNKGIIFLMIVPYVLLFLLFRKKISGFFKELGQAQG